MKATPKQDALDQLIEEIRNIINPFDKSLQIDAKHNC